MASSYLFRMLHCVQWGFGVSLLYGTATTLAVWRIEPASYPRYVEAFVASFNCLISGGLVIGTALFVLFTEASVPALVEKSFPHSSLQKTSYFRFKRRYSAKVEQAVFSATYVVIAFGIFYYCQFPYTPLLNNLLLFFACIQYGLLLYVGRKIYFTAYMLNSLSMAPLRRSVLRDAEITNIASYVNIVSALTVASLYANAVSFYRGPFVYSSILGYSPKLFLLLPVVAAVPAVIIFNFYPRVILRRLYEKSIAKEVAALQRRLRKNSLSAAEFEAISIDYDRLKQAELKERLQLTLSDAPMAVAIIVAVIGLVSKL
jgi:hypothetical protein